MPSQAAAPFPATNPARAAGPTVVPDTPARAAGPSLLPDPSPARANEPTPVPATTPARAAEPTSLPAPDPTPAGRPPITGLHVPLVTPFDAAGRVDLAALERLAVHALDSGADGLVALGTTAEAPTLSLAERDAIVELGAAVCFARGVPLTVGAGGNDTAAVAREVARLGEQPGVSALLSVVPPYSRPSTAGVVAHFEQLAAAGPLPLIVYEIPQRTGIRLGAEALLALHEAAPQIAGVKLAVPALDDDALTLLAQAPPTFAVLAGEDQLIFSMAAAGGAGAISAAANLQTARFAALLAAVERSDLAAARAEARALRPLVRALFAEPNPAVIKAALHAEGLIPTADVRLPLVRASAPAVASAADALAQLGAHAASLDVE